MNLLKSSEFWQRKKNGGSFLYLAQKIGEPAQNAIWLPGTKLPPKAQTLLLTRPPPLIQ